MPTRLSAAEATDQDRLRGVALQRAGVRDFESVVRQYSPALIRTLTLVVLDREAAADIAQETFIQVHRHWDKVSEHPHLPGWIYRVGINRAKDYRRSLARAARLVERLGSTSSVRQPIQPWQPEIEFTSILRDLSQRQRAAAALHYVGDLSVPEVAQIMGISEGAVKSHLHRARLALKDMLEEE
jgi:RNA polymerase sigma-70 factor, ECF subfamily